MAIKDIYNSIASKFSPNSISYSAIPDLSMAKTISPSKIIDSLRYLESTNGKSPDTPRNQIRDYTDLSSGKPKKVQYNIGYAGEYGITPSALSELSRIHKLSPEDIQRQLMNIEGSGSLSSLYFNRIPVKDYSPQGITNHYIENYMGKGTQNDTPQNHKRVLDYYNGLAQ